MLIEFTFQKWKKYEALKYSMNNQLLNLDENY
jgi:hypothetical protein